MKIRTVVLTTFIALALSASTRVCTAAEASDADRIFTVDELQTRPEVVKVRPPQYPAELAGSGQSGLVAITVVIDEAGDVESIEVTKASAPAFGEAAVACVRQWKFSPATMSGRNVKVKMSLPVRFQADITTVARN